MEVAIVSAIITALASVVVALINNGAIRQGNKERKMYAAKQSILQMIMEDEMSVELMNKLPTNHSRILYEYDVYKRQGGNSDIDEKIEEYKKWYSGLKMED